MLCEGAEITLCSNTGWALAGWNAVPQEKVLGVLEDMNLMNTNWQCALSKQPTTSWAVLTGVQPAGQGLCFSPFIWHL